jgi:Arc/MetJ family transcription regulator
MCRRIIAMREQYVLRSVSMKRTNLVLDEDLLEEATRLSGERTYSKTVERALNEMVRRVKARQILDLAAPACGREISK